MTQLVAEKLTFRIGARTLLDTVDLHVSSGELVGLIGPNGAGKTTLLNVLAGLFPPTDGAVRLDGRDLDHIGVRERAQAIGYLEQGAPVYWPLTVERLVALGRHPHLSPLRRESAEDRQAIADAMARCSVADFSDRAVTTLSTGEKARVMLARVLAGTPRIILADEPVAGLDPFHQIEVMSLLRTLCDRGAGGVVVLHDLALAHRYCTRLVLLAQGTLRADGAPDSVLGGPEVARAYGVRMAMGKIGDRMAVVVEELS